MNSTKTYKGYTLTTHKMRGAKGYETFIFNGGVTAINRTCERLKKHSIALAECLIDNNEAGNSSLWIK
jgi:hypothetical protein